MASTISAGTTSGTAIAITGDTTGALALQTNGTTTAVTINTSQNVGIGTATPTGKLDVSSSSAGVTAGDLVVDTANKTVYVGRQSSTGGDNSYLVVRGRLNGSGTNQAIVITGDTTAYGTGIFRPGNDIIGFSTLATERMRIDSSGNLLFNSGYGSAATAFGCRAWVNFNGTGTVAIRASGNVSSITDNGTGDYTVNFTTAMPDINYSTVASSSIAADGTFSIPVVDTKSVGGNAIVAPTTSAVRLTTQGNGGSAGARDAEYVNVTIVR